MPKQLPPPLRRNRKRGKLAELQERVERLERSRKDTATAVGQIVIGALARLIGGGFKPQGPGFEPGDLCRQCKGPATRANKDGYPVCNLYPQCWPEPAKSTPR